MKMYITSESFYRVKNGFLNINAFAIIDVNLIINTLNLDMSKSHNVFLVNREIKNLIKINSKNKKIKGIIYIVPKINEDILFNIKNIINEVTLNNDNDIILLDDYDTPKLEKYYNCVEEIMFFSTFRKIKIIECKQFKK
jgi:hypothetical protein